MVARAAVAPVRAAAVPVVAGLLGHRVEEFARQTATAVRLDDLYRWGLGDMPVRLQMARFMHREIAIRNAQLCKELRLLPFGLAETRGVNEVIRCFSSYVDCLAESKQPENPEDDGPFTELLQGILEDHMEVVRTLGGGVVEVREALGEARYEDIRTEVDHILDRFFMKRIGLRFLISHYVESQTARVRPGVSGIIHSNVEVGRILRAEAAAAQQLCREMYGQAPEVIVVGDGQENGVQPCGHGVRSSAYSNLNLSHNREFTYVPSHLQFSCQVLLQHACFSVAEAHANVPPEERRLAMPPVQAIFAYGREEVAVKVSDQGGGIPRSQAYLSWSYFSVPSGNGDSESSSSKLGMGWRHSAPLGSGNPKGAGLPLARLHARYYGGDLVLKSIEGFGTDAHLFLNRLGHNCENLPHGVRLSPAMRDSSLGKEASIQLDDLGPLTPAEVKFLKRRLAQFRKENAASVASLG